MSREAIVMQAKKVYKKLYNIGKTENSIAVIENAIKKICSLVGCQYMQLFMSLNLITTIFKKEDR